MTRWPRLPAHRAGNARLSGGRPVRESVSLIIIASGLVFPYRANVWNIGAEGQMIPARCSPAMALLGGMLALLLFAMILAGILGGLAGR